MCGQKQRRPLKWNARDGDNTDLLLIGDWFFIIPLHNLSTARNSAGLRRSLSFKAAIDCSYAAGPRRTTLSNGPRRDSGALYGNEYFSGWVGAGDGGEFGGEEDGLPVLTRSRTGEPSPQAGLTAGKLRLGSSWGVIPSLSPYSYVFFLYSLLSPIKDRNTTLLLLTRKLFTKHWG